MPWFRFIIYALASTALLFCAINVSAKYYKYTDENGVTHFTDDYGYIPDTPPEGGIETISEPYDHLPPKERKARIEEDHRKAQELQKQTQNELDRLRIERQERDARHRRKIQEQLNEYSDEGSTPFQFCNNSIYVNVTIGYYGGIHKARLILDTGASGTVLYEPTARRMGLHTEEAGEATLAGGETADFEVATLDYLQLGPKRLNDITISVFGYEDKNTPGYDGLLGMDFLKNFPHTINLHRRIIMWEDGDEEEYETHY
ncbi:MAG: aspartyl protease family protein [Desulfobacterales bacterium]|nr:aspartyl protease family protein [Desulfobacterales bacterium]